MFRFKFSGKFYLGIVLIILSLVLGKVTQAVFIIYFNNLFLRWLAVIFYVLSWPMLIIGAWWVGKEWYEKLKKYFAYKFYHESLKRGTKRAYGVTRDKTKRIKERVKGRLERRKKSRKN